MFSEYASRFLAESQSRLSAIRDRRFLQQGNENAPLFFSVADYPADDRAHDEEVSDYYALKKSRRLFGGYERHSVAEEQAYDNARENSVHEGIRSSWKPESSASSQDTAPTFHETTAVAGNVSQGQHPPARTLNISELKADKHSSNSLPLQNVAQIDVEGRANVLDTSVQPSAHNLSSSGEELPYIHRAPVSAPLHNIIWAKAYGVSLAFLLATSFMIWIKTDVPRQGRLGDGIYSVLHNALPLFAMDTFFAALVSVIYLALLRLFVKPLVYLLVVSIPVATIAMGLYSLNVSYKGGWEGNKIQATVLRWTSVLPFFLSMVWVYSLYRSRKALGGAVRVTELACKILNKNPALVLLSFSVLLLSAGLTWAWIAMFSRVFLQGKPTMSNGKPGWVVYPSSWSMGTYFVVMYLWTLNLVHGMQRAAAAATVSHWYFYRHEIPKSSSNTVVGAAIRHATTTTLGTVCFSTFLSLLIRLPALALPQRFGSIARLFCFDVIASPIISLTSPLTLTYAAVHSVPLIQSSRHMHEISRQGLGNCPRPVMGPGSAYYLSKMCLSAIRGITALILGVLAWVRAARDLNGGSLYGYIVGLSAAAIGWAILGASEGMLSNIVDSCMICVLSEGQETRYCHEAREAFGNS